MKTRHFVKQGVTIIREGSFGDCAFIVEDGKFEVSKKGFGGINKILGTLKQYDIFGEMGLIDGAVRSATVTAMVDSRIRILSKESYENLQEHNPQVLIPLLKVLSQRLRGAMEMMA